MARYLAGRIAGLVLILFLVCLFTYLIFFKLSPDPAVMICGKTCTPGADPDQIRDVLGLDQPFLTQFWDFLTGCSPGGTTARARTSSTARRPCLGYCFQTSQSVWQMIVDRLPVSATVAIGAAVLWLLDRHPGRAAQRGQGGHLVGPYRDGAGPRRRRASPTTCSRWRCSTSWWCGCRSCRSRRRSPFSDGPVLWFQSYLMPWVVLATGYACLYARLTRANVIDTLAENFMRTARAKGLPPALTMRRHALRPALTPIATIFGMDFAGAAGRRADHRDRLRPQRRRQDGRRLDRQERPAGDHGGHAPRGVLRGGGQRRGRPRLHRARPESEDHRMSDLLVVEDLTVTFPTTRGRVDVVKDVSFTVGSGRDRRHRRRVRLRQVDDQPGRSWACCRAGRVTRGSIRLDGVELLGRTDRQMRRDPGRRRPR